jgi:hypothetical protein
MACVLYTYNRDEADGQKKARAGSASSGAALAGSPPDPSLRERQEPWAHIQAGVSAMRVSRPEFQAQSLTEASKSLPSSRDHASRRTVKTDLFNSLPAVAQGRSLQCRSTRDRPKRIKRDAGMTLAPSET